MIETYRDNSGRNWISTNDYVCAVTNLNILRNLVLRGIKAIEEDGDVLTHCREAKIIVENIDTCYKGKTLWTP